MNLREQLAQVKRKIIEGKILRTYKAENVGKLGQYRLAELFAVSATNPTAYADIMDKLYAQRQKELRDKQRIKVAFVLYSASMWSCDDLYQMFESDDRFVPYVAVCKYTNESNKQTWPTYTQSLAFFAEKGYQIQKVADDTPKNRGWQALGEPDVVFYLTPYHTLLPVGVNQGYLPGKVLTIYIPYSYMLIGAAPAHLPGFAYSWKHYCDSQIYKRILLEYDPLFANNTYFVGYPKMDAFFEPCEKDPAELWKLTGEGQKKIIYAPHHSLKDLEYCASHFATFDKNGQFILELAKKYPQTSWIIKPHPNMKMTVLLAGVFKAEEEYYDYLSKWEALPNAKVVQEGSYVDYFKTSDAMIGDSVSFLAEYQFTGKPQLLLTRPEQEFNEFGAMVQSVLYKCPGEDLNGIEAFLNDVVIDGKDTMATVREQFFNENLNYYKKNGNLKAAKKIFAELSAIVSDSI